MDEPVTRPETLLGLAAVPDGDSDVPHRGDPPPRVKRQSIADQPWAA
jgi:hypothetical protein